MVKKKKKNTILSIFLIDSLFKMEERSTYCYTWIFNSNFDGLFKNFFSLVCWDSATINKRATDSSYKLKVDILTFSSDVNSKKWHWIWNPLRFIPWFKHWPCPNYYLCFSIFAPYWDMKGHKRSITNDILFQEKWC